MYIDYLQESSNIWNWGYVFCVIYFIDKKSYIIFITFTFTGVLLSTYIYLNYKFFTHDIQKLEFFFSKSLNKSHKNSFNFLRKCSIIVKVLFSYFLFNLTSQKQNLFNEFMKIIISSTICDDRRFEYICISYFYQLS